MLPIRKLKTPALLLRYQYAPGAEWDGPTVEVDNSKLTFTCVKVNLELRSVLVAEQHGLCAYCMRSIKSVPTDVRIEHVQSQAKYPKRQLDYKNLVACCHGQLENSRRGTACCDQSKEDKELSFDPADPYHDISLHLKYDRLGRGKADNELLQRDLDSTLNLNVELLRLNRGAVYKALIESVKKTFGVRSVNLKWIEKQIQSNEERAEWPAFWGCLRFFLQKMKHKAKA